VSQGNFQVGDVSGIGNAIGPNARASVRIGAEQANEIKSLIAELRKAIADAPIPEPTKKVLAERTIPALEQAPSKSDPKEAVQNGLERVSEQLEGVGAVGDKVVRIAEIAKKLAGIVGVTLGATAPFLGKLLG
jgi:hypothetical protein